MCADVRFNHKFRPSDQIWFELVHLNCDRKLNEYSFSKLLQLFYFRVNFALHFKKKFVWKNERLSRNQRKFHQQSKPESRTE